MLELTDIHPDRFYSNLVAEAKLIEERVYATNNENDVKVFYGFEDAIDEADEEGYMLESYGEAYYFFNGKVYFISVHLENCEAVGVNELEHQEIVDLINQLINSFEDEEEIFYSENEWAKAFLNK